MHLRYRTPHVAIGLHAAICFAFSTTGTFRGLALLASVADLMVYLVICLASMELRRRRVRTDRPPLDLRGGPLIALLGCGAILWLLGQAAAREFLGVGALLVTATAVFFLAEARRPRGPAHTGGSALAASS